MQEKLGIEAGIEAAVTPSEGSHLLCANYSTTGIVVSLPNFCGRFFKNCRKQIVVCLPKRNCLLTKCIYRYDDYANRFGGPIRALSSLHTRPSPYERPYMERDRFSRYSSRFEPDFDDLMFDPAVKVFMRGTARSVCSICLKFRLMKVEGRLIKVMRFVG